MPRTTNWGAHALTLAGGAVATYAWTDFLWPPVSFYRHTINPSPVQVLLECLKPENQIYKDNPIAGYLFVFVTVSLLAFAFYVVRGVATYFDVSFKQLSILDIEFSITFHGDDLRRATQHRSQSFHANRARISAYKTNSSLDRPEAAFDHTKLRSESCIGSRKITKEHIKRMTPRNLELIEAFDRELPTSLLASLLPSSVVRALFRNNLLFKNIVVTRWMTIENMDEYNGEVASLQLTIGETPATIVTLKVQFPRSTAPPHESMLCFIISEGAVEPIRTNVQDHGEVVIYEVTVQNLHRTNVRLQWSNERLTAWQDAQAA